MKFLGENKLFEMALKYWGISIREAFERFDEVEYEICGLSSFCEESLFFYSSDENAKNRVFSVHRSIYPNRVEIDIRRLDGLYEVFSQDDLLKILGDESQETDKEKEKAEKELEPSCEDCECYNCTFYSMGCSLCSECRPYDEAIPFHGCGNFVLDEPFIDYD